LHILPILYILQFFLTGTRGTTRKRRKYLCLVQASTAISIIFSGTSHSRISNVEKPYALLDAIEGVTESDWEATSKRAEIAEELTLERARRDLSDDWKAWLKENGQGKARGTKEVIRPASGSGSQQECSD
jgi:hypothetical protein